MLHMGGENFHLVEGMFCYSIQWIACENMKHKDYVFTQISEKISIFDEPRWRCMKQQHWDTIHTYIYHTRLHKCWLLARTLHNWQFIFTLWWVKHVIITKQMYIFNCAGFKQIICIWRLLFDRYICVWWHCAVSCTFISVLKSIDFFIKSTKKSFFVNFYFSMGRIIAYHIKPFSLKKDLSNYI